MARNGFKVFDTDTHTGPVMQLLDKYLTDAERAKLADWKQFRVTNTGADHYKDSTTYSRGTRVYRRVLGAAKADESRAAKPSLVASGAKPKKVPSTLLVDSEPSERVKDMNIEGSDAHLMLPSGWFGCYTASDDVALEMGMYRAYNRWMNDYCSAYPDRLGGVALISARDIPGSVEEIKRWSKSRWAWGIEVYAPYGMPLDHPDLEPVWAAAQEYDYVVALHVYAASPPYAPGSMDTWENRFLQGSVAHPWCGQRNMAALICSGVMDRYPKLRIGTLEAGHSWLPYWMAQLDEHAHHDKVWLPELKHKPSEYVTSGRYFQSIEIHEGARLTNAVMDLVGEDILMYASDYPHMECHYPDSVNDVLAWDMSEGRKRKLLWDNAVKFYARSGLK